MAQKPKIMLKRGQQVIFLIFGHEGLSQSQDIMGAYTHQ